MIWFTKVSRLGNPVKYGYIFAGNLIWLFRKYFFVVSQKKENLFENYCIFELKNK